MRAPSFAGTTRLLLLLATLAASIPRGSAAQELALSTRAPRFLYVSSPDAGPVEVDVSRTALLQRTVSLDVERATVGRLLAAIERQTGIRFGFSRDVLPANRLVALRAETITVGAALLSILMDTGVDVLLSSDGKVALVKKGAEVAQEGTIVGRVTNAESGEPVEGAEVLLEGMRWRTHTGADGQFRLADVDTGTYVVSVRRIGFGRQTRSVTVSPGREVTADFALRPAPTRLEELVTTGTYVPTEVRALPTPVTVIESEEIIRQRPQILNDLLRQVVPTVVSPNRPADPEQTSFSARGASSLSGIGQLKVFLDGVEMSVPGTSPVDLNSIERIEVVRGPQAATIYGSDAAAGVIQIFTKRGDAAMSRPQVTAQTTVGLAQTPYSGFRTQLRQNYGVGIRGGAPSVGYSLGASYTHMADYLPRDELSRQSTPSLYGAMQFARGMLNVDISARYFRTRAPSVTNPLLWETGLESPNFTERDFVNSTYGAQAVVKPTSWWRNQLTLGFDQSSLDQVQTQPRLTSAADTLLSVGTSESRKASIAFNSSVSGSLDSKLAGSMTVGIDHYNRPTTILNTFQAVNTDGTIQTEPAGSFSVTRATVTNSGYFAQAQASFQDAVFVTAGLRVEENTAFGRDLGSPALPRIGISLVRDLGQVTIKLRSAYGEAIRAPNAGQAFGSASPTFVIEPNSLLAPERQSGLDAGIDLTFGSRVAVSVTAFDQTARNLILAVQRGVSPVLTSQFQNVGRVDNSGVEFDGSMTLDRITVRGQYGYVRSRIRDLGPNFTGDDQVGDVPRQLPAHTAGGSVTWTPLRGTSLTSGVTHVGSYRDYDFIAALSCLGGTGPCPDPLTSLRDFIIKYPGFAKMNLSVTQRVSDHLSGYVGIDNLTNTERYEAGNAAPVIGRITSFGLTASF